MTPKDIVKKISKFKGGIDIYSNFKVWNPDNDYCMALHVKDGATVVINGGNFLAGYETVYVYKGHAIINDGVFFAQRDASRGNKIFELNCKDNFYKDGTASIVVKGGKYIDFDPAANGSESSDLSTNFVAVGYKSVKLDETYTYKHKVQRNGESQPTEEEVEVNIYEVVPSSDPREGTEGTVVILDETNEENSVSESEISE